MLNNLLAFVIRAEACTSYELIDNMGLKQERNSNFKGERNYEKSD